MKRQLIAAIAFAAASQIAFAGPSCTDEAKSSWQNAEAFQAALKEQGYNIKKFKVTSGNCYEIYAYNKENQKVEIYFHPVSGEIVKQEIED